MTRPDKSASRSSRGTKPSARPSPHPSPRTRTKGFRPDGDLADEALARGRKAYNLWYVYSAKAGADLVLKSDAEMLHVWDLELDPQARSYRIETPRGVAELDHQARGTIFDAEVRRADGCVELREVKSVDAAPRGPAGERDRLQQEAQEQVAAALGALYRRIGPSYFRSRAPLIDSGKVALATMAAARDYSIVPQQAQLLALLRRQPQWTAEALLQQVAPEEQALFLAAVFTAVSRGELQSDLHARRWGRTTRLWLPDSDPPAPSGQAPQHLAGALSPAERARAVAKVHAEANRALRTAGVSAALALNVERAEAAESAGRYTRKNLPPEYRDCAKWPAADFEACGDEAQRERALRLRAAIVGYLQGGAVAALEREHGVSRAEILRLLNRALLPHSDGILGWRALLRGFHVEGYRRQAPVQATADGAPIGFAGALEQLFERYPDIRRSLVETILKQDGPYAEPVVNTARVHSDFLKLCAQHGVGVYEYPFNCLTQARRAIARFTKQVREEHFTRSALLLGGTGAAKRAKLYGGHEPLMQHREPYDAVQQDAHTLDLIGTVTIPHPKGKRRIPVKRLALQIVLEVECKAVLGYSVCLRGRISAQDAMAAVQHALSVWEPMDGICRGVSYPEGAGFPSRLIPGLAGATWATHYLDNDSAYTSELVCERIRRRLGCAVNFGPVGDWTRRHVIEGVFGVLESTGFQRLPTTVGSHPKDPRRDHAERKAVELDIDYQELLYLLDVALATYNATARPALGYRSPLQLLRERTQDPRSNFLPRFLPPLLPSMPEMHVVVERHTVRGNMAGGRRPYIEIDGVRHTSALLSGCPRLIGREIVTHTDEGDMRQVLAFLPDGSPLGSLIAQSGWNRVPHTRQMRKLINRLRHDGTLRRSPLEDWAEAYLRGKAEQAAHESARRPTQVSAIATQVADIAHRTGLEVPVVEDPQAPVEAPAAPPPDPAWPAFLPRPVRRATF